MFDKWQKIETPDTLSNKISLYKYDNKEYFLIRHFPFGFAKVKVEYIEEIIKNNLNSKTKTSDELGKFINVENKIELNNKKHLRRLNLLIVQKCNCRCKYCYAGEGDYGIASVMPFEVAKKAIHKAFEYFDFIESIQFFGGEPFLDPQLIEKIVKYTHSLAIKMNKNIPTFSVVTNLTILPENILKMVSKKELAIITSLDGPENVHNSNRIFASGEGTYNKVVENIKKLTPYNQLKTIQATYNMKHIEMGITPKDIKDHISKICGDSCNIVVIPDLNLPAEKSIDTSHFELKYYSGLDFNLIDREKLKKLLSQYLKVFTKYSAEDVFCDLGISNFSIDANGKIWACQILCNKTEPLGNINENWDLIMNRYKEGLGSKLKKSLFKECKDCFLNKYCTACPIAWQRRTNKFAPYKEQCELDRKAYLTALRLSLVLQKMEDKC